LAGECTSGRVLVVWDIDDGVTERNVRTVDRVIVVKLTPNHNHRVIEVLLDPIRLLSHVDKKSRARPDRKERNPIDWKREVKERKIG
jgi:hypothetical protein